MNDLWGEAWTGRIARHVTFGSSGLDRAAPLRGRPDGLTEVEGRAATVLPFWKGKPLMTGAGTVADRGTGAPSDMAAGPDDGTGSGAMAPCWLPPDTPGLDAALEPPVFLGLDDGVPRLALDLSAWVPQEGPPATLGAFADPSEQVHPAFPEGHRFAELRSCMIRLDTRGAELAATARALLSWHARHRFCANCGAATLPAQAGWQRDCAACGAVHYPRTDPVAIMAITHGDAILLGRSPGWPPRMFSLLAGFVEPGETVEAAVRRETYEEAGVRVGPVRYLVSQPWPFPASLMLACQGEALGREITIDPVEIEAARWVTREEMLRVMAGTHAEVAPARPGAIARFVIEHWLADRLGEIRA